MSRAVILSKPPSVASQLFTVKASVTLEMSWTVSTRLPELAQTGTEFITLTKLLQDSRISALKGRL